jgi:hypothetical protein
MLNRPWRDRAVSLAALTILLCGTLPATAASIDVEQTLGPPRVTESDHEVQITKSGPNVDIQATYPRLSGAGAEAANQTVAARVEALIEEFRGEYRSFIANSGGEHLGAPWTLQIGYEPPYATPGFWSLGLALYHYTGGAHGGQERIALVLERPGGRELTPADLFRDDSNWLQVLSDYCYQALQAREPLEPGDEWLRSGTAPQPENYRVILPRATGLEVHFGQYQVGPYAIGSFDVTVPYDKLAGVLNPALFPES